MDQSCRTCGEALNSGVKELRFCSERCRQVAFAASTEEQKSPDILLVRFFFALMNEVMEGPVTPELIDQANRMRDQWQQDLATLREKIAAQREKREEPSNKSAKPKQTQARSTPQRIDLNSAFQSLQLHPNASLEELHRAFRSLATRYHPDRHPDDPNAEDRFKRLNHSFHLIKIYLKNKAALAR